MRAGPRNSGHAGCDEDTVPLYISIARSRQEKERELERMFATARLTLQSLGEPLSGTVVESRRAPSLEIDSSPEEARKGKLPQRYVGAPESPKSRVSLDSSQNPPFSRTSPSAATSKVKPAPQARNAEYDRRSSPTRHSCASGTVGARKRSSSARCPKDAKTKAIVQALNSSRSPPKTARGPGLPQDHQRSRRSSISGNGSRARSPGKGQVAAFSSYSPGHSRTSSPQKIPQVFDDLYLDSIRHHVWKEEATAKRREEKKKLEERELAETCTFKPKINRKTNFGTSSEASEVFHRLGNDDLKRRQTHLKEAKIQSEKAKLAGCTFKPKIEKTNTDADRRPLVERMEEDLKKRNEELKRRKASEEEKAKEMAHKKSLNAAEQAGLIKRMERDARERDRKRVQEMEREEARQRQAHKNPKKDSKAISSSIDRLYQDKDRQRHLDKLRRQAEMLQDEECPFKPTVSQKANEVGRDMPPDVSSRLYQDAAERYYRQYVQEEELWGAS